MNPRICADDNPKIVLRRYNWDGEIVEFSLCKEHCQDSDFSNFISETSNYGDKLIVLNYKYFQYYKITVNVRLPMQGTM